MKQIITANTSPDWPNIEIDYKKKISYFVDSLQGYNQKEDSFKIFHVKEAEAICKLRNEIIKNQHNFDAIITFDEEILKNCKNSHFLLFGTAWVHKYNFPEKKFQISNITGYKEITDGHLLRKKLHYKQTKIKNPIDFYISKYGGVENFNNNKVLGDGKELLFDSQFHICIENSRQNNYFTEKLIDCFQTKTIPIYWGCPNIEEFFDANGFFIANSFDDIINICNSVDKKTYQSKLEIVEKNFILSKEFATIVDRLEILIKKILKVEKNNIL